MNREEYGFTEFTKDFVIELYSELSKLLEKIGEGTDIAVTAALKYSELGIMAARVTGKYYRLGRLCYEMHRDDSDETERMKLLITEIKLLEEDIKYAAQAAKRVRNCESCGARNPARNNYCEKCGRRIN